MEDPVIATDGYTYERTAIENWLLANGTSPQTREPMSANSLVTNRAIADMIQEHLDSNKTETNNDDNASPAAATSNHSDDESDSNEGDGTKRTFLPDELETFTAKTHATLHIVHSHNTSNIEPSSVRVHIKTPDPSVEYVDTSITTPNHVCCVIDVSGSMGLPATSKDESGNPAIDMGLNILDVVKFSTNVIAQSLNSQDMLSIITYGDRADVALPPTFMTLGGKKMVKTTLKTMPLQSRTNLFAGIKLGITTANKIGNEFINSIFVLTDGIPTEHPPLGYERSLYKILSRSPIFGTLSTFGFGYQLDSKLLVNIANIGGGYYSFIPDSGMVGTCFINAVANCRCAFGVQPMLKISGYDCSLLANSGIDIANCNKSNGIFESWGYDKNTTAKEVHGLTLDGCLETFLVDGNIHVRLTPLRYGADVDVMLKPILFSQKADDIKIEVIFDIVGGKSMHLDVLPDDTNTADELFHSTRTQFVNTAVSMNKTAYVRGCCSTFTDSVKDTSGQPDLEALYMDMKGQATEAVSGYQNFESWGKHYLLSLSTAHLHQFCNNFKDPGVQAYGTGILFSFLQNSLDDIFEKLPLPVPSRVVTQDYSSFTKGPKPANMKVVFNNKNCVCVHGKTIVTVKTSPHLEVDNCNDNATSFPTSSSTISYIPICKIKKGDLVLTANGTFVKVDCVVQTVTDDKAQQHPFELIEVGQLCVTPYHPVKLNEQSGWQFPIDISQQYTTTNSVYNLILESGQRHNAVIMDGIETITLGHGITDDVILNHTYFGTDKIITDLKKMRGGSGWEVGHIVITDRNVMRDAEFGRISHISGVRVDEGVATVSKYNSCVSCTA